MRSRPEHIVEALRDAAEDEAEDAPGLPMTEGDLWQAADLIEWLLAALALIRDGAEDPVAIATDALDLKLWRAADPGSSAAARLTTDQVIAKLNRK